MKLGVLLFPAPGASAQLARMAEGLGFDRVVFADTQNLTPEVWGQLMLAARDTERIELGTGVTNPGTRDVAVTASAALALRVESHGRAACGIGRGDSSLAKIGRPPVSISEFEVYVARLQAYLRGEKVDRDGIVGPVETAVRRFQRLAALGLDFCRVVPGSRDAPAETVSVSMMSLATEVRPAVA